MIRTVVLALFLAWHLHNPNRDAMWLWGLSIVCEVWFGFSWLLDVVPNLNPINRATNLAALHDKFDQPFESNLHGCFDLLVIDVFVSTSDLAKFEQQ
ncbi:Cellulose synthase-like protein D1 [Morella rubra]|uniref:Cellulose synthase-like protein D1 n=1 Tax=Morella rubra TaxID=262757 RepID=A0A6A1WDU4_9ROSI|nr:Cellulose synthase-like protein D1 [Morella rubra]